MRRILTFLCTVTLLLSLCACGRDRAELKEPVEFYFCNKEIVYHSPTGVVCSEAREGAGYTGELAALLRDYLKGPVSSDLYSMIPNGTSLLSCEEKQNSVILEFSPQFAQLSGIKLSIACSCIVMTVHAYTGMETVHFRVEGSLLDNKSEMIVHLSDIVFMDTSVKKG